jgi:hypothetical protein
MQDQTNPQGYSRTRSTLGTLRSVFRKSGRDVRVRFGGPLSGGFPQPSKRSLPRAFWRNLIFTPKLYRAWRGGTS